MKQFFTIVLFLTFLTSCAQRETNTVQYSITQHYEVLGTNGGGPPLLIINGGPGMHSEGFRPLAKRLSNNYTAIIYDQRGTGKSTLSKVDSTTVTLDLMVNDIEYLRQQLNIEQWVIMGHSFGGMLAAYYATKHPESLQGLIFSSSGGLDLDLFSSLNIRNKLSPMHSDSLAYWSNVIAGGDTTFHAKYQRAKHLAPAYLYDDTHVAVVANRLTQGNLTINGLVFSDMFKIGFDCKEALTSFSKPVLILQGEHDIIPKSIAEKAHGVFSNSELVYLPKTAHYGWLENPSLYFSTIDAFMQSVNNPGGAK